MKKEKSQSPDKAVKKKAKVTVQNRLIKELKAIATQLGIADLTMVIDIEKETKKLAKKIVKGIKADKPAKKEAGKDKVVTPDTKAVAEPIKKAATPVVSKASAVKTITSVKAVPSVKPISVVKAIPSVKKPSK